MNLLINQFVNELKTEGMKKLFIYPLRWCCLSYMTKGRVMGLLVPLSASVSLVSATTW